MIKAENIVKTFEKNEKRHKKIQFNAVDGISLSVNEGEILGVIGPNGAGKTTLLRILGQLMEATSGKVTVAFGDNEYENQLDIKSKIGYLSGNTKLYGRLSTRELLTILGQIYGYEDEQIENRIKEIEKVLNLETFIDNRIEKLSTGQTQRASISRCLIHDPQIYIFDEPTLGLDILSSSAIVDFMASERDKGKTVIYSTHYMEEAELLCDRIIVVEKGRIILEGTLESIKRDTGAKTLREAFKSLINAKELPDEK